MNEINWENEIMMDLVLWDNYLDFEQQYTGSITLIKEFLNFRLELMRHLKNDYEKTKTLVQEINERNYLKVWFYLDRTLNKQSLLEINNDYEYDFKKRFYGITAVKNEKLQKNENNENI